MFLVRFILVRLPTEATVTQASMKERVRAHIESTYRPHEIFHEDDVVEALGENRQSVSFQLWHLVPCQATFARLTISWRARSAALRLRQAM